MKPNETFAQIEAQMERDRAHYVSELPRCVRCGHQEHEHEGIQKLCPDTATWLPPKRVETILTVSGGPVSAQDLHAALDVEFRNAHSSINQPPGPKALAEEDEKEFVTLLDAYRDAVRQSRPSISRCFHARQAVIQRFAALRAQLANLASEWDSSDHQWKEEAERLDRVQQELGRLRSDDAEHLRAMAERIDAIRAAAEVTK